MKTVLLIRHAKSDWGNPGLDDFDRPLNERGKKDAPEMAKRLVINKIKIDCFIASPAKRAAKTAKYFAEIFGKKPDDIRFEEKLYLAPPSVFFDVIAAIKDKYNSVAIFSHNNGITDFANMLTTTRVDNIPTCAVFAIKADCKSWNEFGDAKKVFLFFYYPKDELGS